MPLWTPYVEVPLDLTKVKEERRSPVTPMIPVNPVIPVAPAPVVNAVQYPYRQQYPTPLPVVPPGYAVPHPQPVYVYPGYGYPQYGLPSVQISPVSVTSACSGCEPAPSPSFYRPQTLSPPKTPQATSTQKPQNFLAEADMLSEDPEFQAFERDALRAMAEKNGGTLLGNNPRMRRAVQTSQAVDDSYRRQRERNNFAAKQSRDRRKLREIHLSLKVAYLKNQVSKLKAQLSVSTCVRCQQP
ncbi:protein giant-like [Pectinophora gossypiella]|uniref:protein giant-like n=1 Tax=Pectinophora gossypiella TaxID=13191 RepID=UPI00214EA8A9|nr:protein giant-like [Pectinophora gossypiella]